MDLNRATIIIRSAHERTELLCEKLILEQGVSKKNLFVVHGVPFSKAMKRSFEIGIERGLPWTFCIDADVLLRPHSIGKMIEAAEKQPSNVCEIQGFVMDKFFGGPREAGNHLYRTSLLGKVIQKIPEEGTDIRPEFFTLRAMEKAGYPFNKVMYILGIHDDEQYYKDIYRKCFVHGVKHLHYADLFTEVWKNNPVDEDFRVALHAFTDSIRSDEEAFINKNQFTYSENFKKLDIQEKKPVNEQQISAEMIEKKVAEWKCPELFLNKFSSALYHFNKNSLFENKVHRVNRLASFKKKIVDKMIYELKKLNQKKL